MIRRYVYDPASGAVIEIGEVRHAPTAAARDALARGDYDAQFNRYASPRAGEQLRAAALERADRREFAARRYGDERRWSD